MSSEENYVTEASDRSQIVRQYDGEPAMDFSSMEEFRRVPVYERATNAQEGDNEGFHNSSSHSRRVSARKLSFQASPSSPSTAGDSITDPQSEQHPCQNFQTFKSPTRVSYSDRFIPSRASTSFSSFSLRDSPNAAPSTATYLQGREGQEGREEGAAAYNSLLRTELFGSEASAILGSPEPSEGGLNRPITGQDQESSPVRRNLFKFKTDGKIPGGGGNPNLIGPESPYSLSPIGQEGDPSSSPPNSRRLPRKIARAPFKVLDAPALSDDFYLNLVDWSDGNVLAVGLGTAVYLWSAATSKVTKLCDLGPEDSIRAVGWAPGSHFLSVGTNRGEVQLWDTATCQLSRTLIGHSSRVGSLAWGLGFLASGGRDAAVLLHDVRCDGAPGGSVVSRRMGHLSEVCGLKWSHDDRELASGGNDNQLLVWNRHSVRPILRLRSHLAAVKALAWSPHAHSLLVSGGGTADRCLRFWNTATGASLATLDTGSQVCNLAWSKNVNEIVSTHGYSQNQINVWRYPTLTKLATLTGHTMRVLFLAVSPDGQTIVTGAGDETLRFWNVFPPSKSPAVAKQAGIRSLGRVQIR